MSEYRNVNGNSNVYRYEIGSDYIIVQFQDGAVYKYSYNSAGPANVEQMKRLANQGWGLNGYINRYARKLYE